MNTTIPLNKNVHRRTLVEKLRDRVRIIKCKNVYTKKVDVFNKKRKVSTKKITVRPDCNIITNLMDTDKFTENIIFNLYKSRWDIEVFFKLIKNNFKFQHVNEKNTINYQKDPMFYCELIITYIMKLIENHYWSDCLSRNPQGKDKKINNIVNKQNGDKKEAILKINKSNLIKEIFDKLLKLICFKDPCKDKIEKFYKSYIILVKNDTGRSFPLRVAAKLPTKKFKKTIFEMVY